MAWWNLDIHRSFQSCGIVGKPEYDLRWSKDLFLSTPVFSRLMHRGRLYTQIRKIIHFTSPAEENPEEPMRKGKVKGVLQESTKLLHPPNYLWHYQQKTRIQRSNFSCTSTIIRQWLWLALSSLYAEGEERIFGTCCTVGKAVSQRTPDSVRDVGIVR